MGDLLLDLAKNLQQAQRSSHDIGKQLGRTELATELHTFITQQLAAKRNVYDVLLDVVTRCQQVPKHTPTEGAVDESSR